jgi:hypothetical protein
VIAVGTGDEFRGLPRLPERATLPFVNPICRTALTAGTTHFSNESVVAPTFTFTASASRSRG